MEFFNSLKRTIISYLVLFTLDFLIELFQINHSGKVITLFGVVIKSTFTDTELRQTFSLHYQMLFALLVILFLNLMYTWITHRRKISKKGKN